LFVLFIALFDLVVNFVCVCMYVYVCLRCSDPVPWFSIVDALAAHRCPELSTALNSPLQFRIPTVNKELVSRYGDTFQLADSEYKYVLEEKMRGVSVGGGDSETTVVIDNGGWLKLIILSFSGGIVTYFNDKDASSVVRLRPEVVLYRNGAMFMKIEQKASQHDLMIAREELVDKLSNDACRVFPRGAGSMIGLASAGKLIDLVAITHVRHRVFECQLQAQFNVESLEGRVKFLVSLVKLLRYVVTVDGPNSSFHLVPGIRRKTPTRHHITWIREGLLKEFRHLQSPQQMEWIKSIYDAKLDHVEFGEIQDFRGVTLVQRIGRTLKDCIRDNTVSKQAAYDQIEMGIRELHAVGFAHCDICVSNCFVDDVNGPTPVVFLVDLEYVRPVDMPSPPHPHNSRLPLGTVLPPTAEELDRLQLQTIRLEIARL
jgi:hypothetical protein